MNSALFVAAITESSLFLYRNRTPGLTTAKTVPLTRPEQRRPRYNTNTNVNTNINVQPICCESVSSSGGNGEKKRSIPAWKQMTMDQDVAANSELVRLEEELDAAWYADDEERMAEIRKEIDNLQPTSYVDVLSANLKFYEAFSRGSVADIGSCWLQDSDVMCKHPLGPLFVGFWDIMKSFEALFAQGVADVVPDNIRISVRGSVALVTCDENVKAKVIPDNTPDDTAATRFNPNFSAEKARIRMTAVNIFEKRNGAYSLIFHSSTPAIAPF